ncbi:UNVERIFIED_ORG: NAD(P)-dependent dehydrogenase (short-subunit alcohol dehydrogenase family) [Bacillus sp. 1751]|nr:NAD(P)-dependent dehydrogenase (short-subunit alcohol dehydrogenase family) [Bacillus sp. 1751]
MKRLINKIAVVTGASRAKGIGTEICRELAREGADIFFTHWSKYDRLMDYCNEDDFKCSKHLMEEIRSLGCNVNQWNWIYRNPMHQESCLMKFKTN